MLLNHFLRVLFLVVCLFSLSNTNASAGSVDDLLIKSVANNEIKMVKKAIARGANVNAVDKSGNTALHIATGRDQPSSEIINYLISKKANVNQVNNNGESPLLNLVHRGDKNNVTAVKVAKILVDAGADRMISNKDGKTALQYAVNKKWQDMISVLLPFLACCR